MVKAGPIYTVVKRLPIHTKMDAGETGYILKCYYKRNVDRTKCTTTIVNEFLRADKYENRDKINFLYSHVYCNTYTIGRRVDVRYRCVNVFEETKKIYTQVGIYDPQTPILFIGFDRVSRRKYKITFKIQNTQKKMFVNTTLRILLLFDFQKCCIPSSENTVRFIHRKIENLFNYPRTVADIYNFYNFTLDVV